MNSTARVEELILLPYDVIVRRHGGGVTALCPDLRLSADGASVDDALAGLDANRRDFFTRYVAAGEPGPLPGPAPLDQIHASTRSGAAALPSPFASVVLAAAGTVLGLAIVAVLLIASAPMIGREGYRMAMAGLAEISKVTPERVREIQTRAAEAGPKVRPILAELLPLGSTGDCRR